MAAKTIAEKLVIKPGNTVWVSHPERADLIGELPEGSTTTAELKESNIAVVFADDAASARRILTANQDHLAEPGILWVAYPKANRTDVNRDTLWPILSEYGFRPNGQVAVDEIWSALRFRPLRDGEEFALGKKA
jgi:hypothetical protein